MPPENSIINLEVDYKKMQGMIFGEKIPFNEVMEGIKSLEKEIHHLPRGEGIRIAKIILNQKRKDKK